MVRALAITESEIATRIYVIRGRKVMLDSDLTEIYGVSTSRLNEQFLGNRERFPNDFASELSGVYNFDIADCDIKANPRGGRRKPPVENNRPREIGFHVKNRLNLTSPPA
ncbi:MAG TPA: ORF6N domain-containing protein [Verrucomicrobiae bacterium]|jgi:hypothetical protein|nr:ORF6N domain-containing protein [Verrucomicrobiae bacterium]